MDYRTHSIGISHDSFWFKSRHDLTEVFLKKVPITTNQKILNVGSGTGHDLVVLSKFGNIYAMDIEPRAIDLIPDNLVHEKKVGDVCNIPYADNTFDLIVSFDMLEHVENDQKAVAEIYRVLKPGGHFIFTVPAFNALYSGHDKAMKHFRRYNKPMIRHLMKQFEKKELGYWFFFLFLPAALHRLITKKSSRQSPYVFPAILDKTIYAFLKIENWLIARGMKFPFGLTAYGIYKKAG